MPAGVVVARDASMPFGAFTSFTFLTSAKRSLKVPTVAGWTPGLRALVDGRLLPCGCLVGTYETWIGTHVTIIDGRGDACPIAAHMPNAVL